MHSLEPERIAEQRAYENAQRNVISLTYEGIHWYYCGKEECICKHTTKSHPQHREVEWTVCYDETCTNTHYWKKRENDWTPRVPKVLREMKETAGAQCPCYDATCQCSGYENHPIHDVIPWTMCWSDNCLTHFDAKDRANYFPDTVTTKFEDAHMRNAIYHQWNDIMTTKDDKKTQTELKATKCEGQVTINVQINKKRFVAMIDSGATGNFMSQKVFDKLGIDGIQKKKAEPIMSLNDQEMTAPVTTESGNLTMTIGDHIETINFDITELGPLDIVLGMPWFREHNPEIDWENKRIKHLKCTHWVKAGWTPDRETIPRINGTELRGSLETEDTTSKRKDEGEPTQNARTPNQTTRPSRQKKPMATQYIDFTDLEEKQEAYETLLKQ